MNDLKTVTRRNASSTRCATVQLSSQQFTANATPWCQCHWTSCQAIKQRSWQSRMVCHIYHGVSKGARFAKCWRTLHSKKTWWSSGDQKQPLAMLCWSMPVAGSLAGHMVKAFESTDCSGKHMEWWWGGQISTERSAQILLESICELLRVLLSIPQDLGKEHDWSRSADRSQQDSLTTWEVAAGGWWADGLGRAEGKLVREPQTERKLFGEPKLLWPVAVLSGRLQSVGMDRNVLEEWVVLLLRVCGCLVLFGAVLLQSSLFSMVKTVEVWRAGAAFAGSGAGLLSGWLAWGSCEHSTAKNSLVEGSV